MRPPRWTTVGIVAVAVAVVVILLVLFWPVSKSGPAPREFDLSVALPTAATTSSNPYGCGTNKTDFLSFPALTSVYYYITVNVSGARVNYWLSGIPTPSNATAVYGRPYGGVVNLGLAPATLMFVFQGCGPLPSVPLGFWGNYTLRASG